MVASAHAAKSLKFEALDQHHLERHR